MKRDWELIREVLIEVEALPQSNNFSYSERDGANAQHVLLLWKAGFMDGIDAGSNEGAAILSPELTWQGHELLDTIRSRALWERIKTTAKERGLELTFDTVKALGKLALEYVTKQGG